MQSAALSSPSRAARPDTFATPASVEPCDLPSTSRSVHDTAPAAVERVITLPISQHLFNLHALRTVLDARQVDAKNTMLRIASHVPISSPNRALLTQQQQSQLQAARSRSLAAALTPEEAASVNEDHEIGLSRTASFLLVDPVARDITQANAEGVFATAAVEKLPMPTRAVLTAQVDALKRHVERISLKAAGDAWSGSRYCPLAMDHEKFAGFLGVQKPAIDRVLEACTKEGEERSAMLQDALNEIGHAYLAAADTLPAGIDPDSRLEMGSWIVGPEPVTIGLNEGEQTFSRYHFDAEGNKVAIQIGIDELDTPDTDPCQAGGISMLHAQGMEHCTIPQKQAGVYLHKLFAALIHMEEKIYLSQNMNKDGSPMPGAPGGTFIEFGYRGSRIFGDKMTEIDPAAPGFGVPGQRDHAMNAFDNLAQLTRIYRARHGEDLLLDPQLDNWLGGPAYYRDALIVKSPASRMHLLAMEHIVQSLVESKSLE
ncbi:MAG: hypothetical protein H7244_06965 [Herminiimonas sp.]|nr:hypothetical protein [Herminiimonas sp.]